MKYLSIVKGNDYALSLVHFIRHGRKYDCIITLDDTADDILKEFDIPHRREPEIINVYLSKVVYLMKYQIEVKDLVCYHDVFVNFDNYEGLEKYFEHVTLNGLIVPDREIYWPGVEKSYLPICKVMFAENIPEKATTSYLGHVTTTDDSDYKDFTYSYYNKSWASWYGPLLNGFADDEITLQLCKNEDWFDYDNTWRFWQIKEFYNESYLNAGHDLLYMNIYSDNKILHIDDDLYARYSVYGEDALNKVSYIVTYKQPEVSQLLILEDYKNSEHNGGLK